MPAGTLPPSGMITSVPAFLAVFSRWMAGVLTSMDSSAAPVTVVPFGSIPITVTLLVCSSGVLTVATGPIFAWQV